MFQPVEPFEMTLNGVRMHVSEVQLPGRRGFHVIFSSKRPDIVVVRATDRKGDKFWTTIPENESRQKEAEGVGKLIQEYLMTLDK